MVMQDAKRRRDGDDKSPFTLSFRFSNDLVKKINLRWKEDGFANRTALVEAACNLYFDSLECPRCGNRNHKNSLYCSICGNTLHPAYEVERKLRIRYDSFCKEQTVVLSLESEVEEERDKYRGRITSAEISTELKSSLDEILHSADESYHLGSTLDFMDENKDDLEYLLSVSNPLELSYPVYAAKLNIVQTFFDDLLTHVDDTPQLLVQEKVNEINHTIDYLNNFLVYYKSRLGKDLNLYAQVNKLIDKLTAN